MSGNDALYRVLADLGFRGAGESMPGRLYPHTYSIWSGAEPDPHADLFPTILDGAQVALARDEAALPGISLWPAIIEGRETARTVFAEYHATGSKAGSFMLRDGGVKLIYHVGQRPQLFDLDGDPYELHDLGDDPAWARERLERELRAICDPEAVDAHAKADQQTSAEAFGDTEAILQAACSAALRRRASCRITRSDCNRVT